MIVIEDWRPPIVEMVLAKQDLAAVDPDGIFPQHFPEVAATDGAVRTAEAALDVVFDAEHRGFLGSADGWKCFHQHVTLMGTAELVAGPLRESALAAFDAMPELLDDLGCSPDSLLPIAASLEQADIFVMRIDDGVVGPAVLWLAEGELIDTFDSFGQFFVSMIDYAKRRTAKMRDAALGEPRDR